jgi:Family of unknown function (DUF5677)
MDSDIKLPIGDSLIQYGFPEDWVRFANRHSEFTHRFHNLADAIDIGFSRVHEQASAAEKIVYFLGRTAIEDFMEILLLCGNGYGIGGQKLIRGLYERVVTASYIFSHPDEATEFADYIKVARRKYLSSVQDTMGRDFVSNETAAKIVEEYQAVKSQFMVTDCKKCETKKLNHSWSKLDIPAMARETEGLYKLIVPAYFEPTQEIHSTLGSVFSRLAPESNSVDGMMFDSRSQEDRADRAIITGHAITLINLGLQKECFKIAELEVPLDICGADYRACIAEGHARKKKNG